MKEINNFASSIECGCGEKFQVVNEEETDWNEAETAELYYAHLELECPLRETK